ncbi:hypothetical protein H488_0103665 [Kocuria sp. UCD-OTCP]|nr:hypothetical protein H488_0103665 [Kocuria sp. UCD-OTCP]
MGERLGDDHAVGLGRGGQQQQVGARPLPGQRGALEGTGAAHAPRIGEVPDRGTQGADVPGVALGADEVEGPAEGGQRREGLQQEALILARGQGRQTGQPRRARPRGHRSALGPRLGHDGVRGAVAAEEVAGRPGAGRQHAGGGGESGRLPPGELRGGRGLQPGLGGQGQVHEQVHGHPGAHGVVDRLRCRAPHEAVEDDRPPGGRCAQRAPQPGPGGTVRRGPAPGHRHEPGRAPQGVQRRHEPAVVERAAGGPPAVVGHHHVDARARGAHRAGAGPPRSLSTGSSRV